MIVAIVWGLWIAVPGSMIESRIRDAFSRENVTVTVEGLRKGLFYRISADRVALTRTGTELITGRNVDVRMDLLGLITFRPRVYFSGRMDGGSFAGVLPLSQGDGTIHFEMSNARLTDVPLFMKAGIRGTGILSGSADVTNGTGRMKFLVADARLESLTYSGVEVPLHLFETVRGVGDIQRDAVSRVSVSLDGRDISARVTGVVQQGYLDLQVEVMPGRTYLENPLFRSSIERYQVSPGYYVIPFKGPISP